jgi:hypothetical protein
MIFQSNFYIESFRMTHTVYQFKNRAMKIFIFIFIFIQFLLEK